MDRCATCKHWMPSEKWDVKAAGLRVCGRVFPKWTVEDEIPKAIRYGRHGWDGDNDPVTAAYRAAADSAFREAGAVANDGSQYRAELLTRPEFGCVLHEPTTNTN